MKDELVLFKQKQAADKAEKERSSPRRKFRIEVPSANQDATSKIVAMQQQ